MEVGVVRYRGPTRYSVALRTRAVLHNRYDLTKRNCNHFTNTLAVLLGVGIARVLTLTQAHTTVARAHSAIDVLCELSLGELVVEYTL